MYQVRIRFCKDGFETVKPCPDDKVAAHTIFKRWVALTDGIPSCNVYLVNTDTGDAISFVLRPVAEWEGWDWNK